MITSCAPHLHCVFTRTSHLSQFLRTAYFTKPYTHCRWLSKKTIIRWPKNNPDHKTSKSSTPNNWSKKVSQKSRSPGHSKGLSRAEVAKHLSHSCDNNDAEKQNIWENNPVADSRLQDQPNSDDSIDASYFPESDLGLSGTFIINGKHGDRVVEDLKVTSSSGGPDGSEILECFGTEDVQESERTDREHLEEKSVWQSQQRIQEKTDSFANRVNLNEAHEDQLETAGELVDEVDGQNDSRNHESNEVSSSLKEKRTVKNSWGNAYKQSQHKRKPQIGQNHEVLYGVSPCLLALQEKRRQFHKAFVLEAFKISARDEAQEIVRLLEERGVVLHETSRGELNKLSQGRPHQGVCLEVSPLHFEHLSKISSELLTIPADKPFCVLALDQILDPMNLGALMRSAYFLGVDKIVASKYKCCPLTSTVSKASSGITEVMPVYSAANMASFLQELASLGWLIMGATSQGDGQSLDQTVPVVPCRNLGLSRPTVLVIGSEGFGLREALRTHCHQLVTIPAGRRLHPNIDSLNVSVATGIILHSLLVKR
ncbi:uncharacterized protein [Apostichopus japonicus]|uniref:uncharacterized protein n=1 Tax=Stichopus japonicus TaxID=307972 RepID=UPI003AB81CA1